MKVIAVKALVMMMALNLPIAAFSNFLPTNTLHLEDDAGNNMTEEQFNQIIDDITVIYSPIVAGLGGRLQINKLWSLNTVNASATRSIDAWIVNMYGGLARRSEITPDAFALVICHELGHHLGGFPFMDVWLANEGESDYFATVACARKIWADQDTENARAGLTIEAYPRSMCDFKWKFWKSRHLCYRIMNASASMVSLYAAGYGIAFDTPSRVEVPFTWHAHPSAQCRLDTLVAGALCEVDWKDDVIPMTYEQIHFYSCTSFGGYVVGVRPRCWFQG
ncbi:MAG: hypothetical protein CMP10_17455 [Zetaproteobacteria bacterium]|nr:hypothetical protein [Pseudobdellovibrionaceae bacterium]|tara:strand:+ start:19 stop:852 length:834 start_codon:yes stop_codon:yes gene_type:complete